MARPTAVRTGLLCTWLVKECTWLEEESQSIRDRERRISSLIGLLIAADMPSDAVIDQMPANVQARFSASVPAQAVAAGERAGPAIESALTTRPETGRPSSRQHLILEILSSMAKEHHAALSSGDLRLRLEARGEIATKGSVQKSLRIMAERGMVIRDNGGRYSVPPESGTATHSREGPENDLNSAQLFADADRDSVPLSAVSRKTFGELR